MSSSVLLTTYNGDAFIEEQLTSILHQTRAVDQVLIFDDGSSDRTVEKVKAFIELNGLDGWSINVNPKNLGPASNILTHLEALSGDIVFLGDQDDVWELNKVAVMTRHMADHPNLSMLVSRTTIVDKDGEKPADPWILKKMVNHSRIHRGPSGSIQELTFDDFVGYSAVPLHAMCVRGDVLRRIGKAGGFPDLSMSLGADWYIGIWSAVLGDCQLLPDTLMRRRVHGGNISLGRLRKKTVLSSTQDRRITMLRESRDAHLALLENDELGMKLSHSDRRSVEQMAAFLAKRIAFSEVPSLARALRLIIQFNHYHRSSGTIRGGVRMWVADVMYALNINWNTVKRAKHG